MWTNISELCVCLASSIVRGVVIFGSRLVNKMGTKIFVSALYSVTLNQGARLLPIGYLLSPRLRLVVGRSDIPGVLYYSSVVGF